MYSFESVMGGGGGSGGAAVTERAGFGAKGLLPDARTSVSPNTIPSTPAVTVINLVRMRPRVKKKLAAPAPRLSGVVCDRLEVFCFDICTLSGSSRRTNGNQVIPVRTRRFVEQKRRCSKEH